MRWLRRILYWLRFSSRERDLRDELALHRELITDDLRRRGLDPAAAAAAARRAMGNETYMREESRSVWLAPRLEAVVKDWRYACRGLRRSPSFAIAAIGSLALGIGANTAIFGIIYTLLLARLPVPAASQLVELRRDLGAKGIDDRFTLDEYDALSGGPMPLAMFASSSGMVEIDGAAINTSLDAVNGSYFELLGIRAQRGRLISPTDDATAAPVAVITDRFWRGRLNADSAVLGRILKIDGQPMTIIGIMPPGFASLRFPAFAELVVPLRAASTLGILRLVDRRRIGPSLTIVGRRAGSESLEAARGRLAVVWNRCCASGQLVTPPRGQPALTSQLALLDVSHGIPHPKLDLRGQYRRILLALMAGVGILLLAACVNVANLLLARNRARAGELAVRLALGGSRARLVMQLVVESLQLSLGGAVFGALLAYWGTAVLMHARIGDLARVVAPSAGPMVLAFTVAISVASGILFGVLSALGVLHTDLIVPLKQGGRGATGGRRGVLNRGLVGLQAALALLLMSGATMLVETLQNLQREHLGFEPAQRLAVTVETRHTAYERQGMTTRLADEMLRRVRAIPGVRSAAFGSNAPVYGGRSVSDNVSVPGAREGDDDANSWFVAVSPGYFSSLGMTLIAGQDIDRTVSGPSARARNVVVNDRFARKFFPNRDPIGQLFHDADEGSTDFTEDRVVGVVGSAKFGDLRAPTEPMYFVQIADDRWPFLVLIIRPMGNAAAVGSAVRGAIANVAPGILVDEPTLMSSSIDQALARERLSAGLATLFGAIALSLVAVGLYGVMLYQVGERTKEIGIRFALGARGTSVVRLVLRQSLTIVAVGLAVGFPLAIVAGHVVASQLYGVAPYSVKALSIAATVLVAVAIVASLVPIRRAMSVDPLTALRAD
ncbi:MAG TPA: ABC transporter permease [Gemmatimonadaceae bacterium]|nr:ABC transporter permease [Gemmatimonadaceae bacterium]